MGCERGRWPKLDTAGSQQGPQHRWAAGPCRAMEAASTSSDKTVQGQVAQGDQGTERVWKRRPSELGAGHGVRIMLAKVR